MVLEVLREKILIGCCWLAHERLVQAIYNLFPIRVSLDNLGPCGVSDSPSVREIMSPEDDVFVGCSDISMIGLQYGIRTLFDLLIKSLLVLNAEGPDVVCLEII